MKYKINFNDTENETIISNELEKFDIQKSSNKEYHVIQNNESYKIDVESIDILSKSLTYFINDIKYQVVIENELDSLIASLGFNVQDDGLMNEIKSPMPGVILEVLVNIGQEVNEGDQLIVLEAMKMENMLKSHGTGTIQAIHIIAGDAVEKDQLLITFEDEE